MSLLDSASWTGRIYSDGWTVGGGGDREVTEPATGRALGRVGLADPSDVSRAAASAAAAQHDWAARPYEARAAILRRAGQGWQEHQGEVQDWLVREAGSIVPKSQVETWFAASSCYEAAGLASLPYGELLQTRDPILSMARRRPVGVVGVISPFNYPLILSIRAVAPALALGNAVVLKPDPRTAVSGGVALAAIFEEAGLPAGLLHVLPGGADVGEALVADPAISMVSFTGSSRAGRLVAAIGARHLKPIHLELGGKNALIVLDDVDVDKAVSVGAFGSFLHQGQICMATGRHIVQRTIVDEYAAKLAEHAEHLPVGDPAGGQVALGPIIDATQRDRVHGMVTASIKAGATLTAGGTYEGLFYRPTVLTAVPTTAPVYADEVFGPVAPIIAFDTVDEAVRLAADTDYGLSLGILTRDVMRGLAIADRIPTGIVHINDQTVADEVVNPFGGVKDSGPGARLGGPQANLETFTQVQWVTLRGDLPAYPF
ncbi:MAG TPA: benzaldehyde dehydrogenase [Candidatus Sulfotelmatobacter sp.]|nr:benzaldehyde dehydrogenase [Candidatus Sulfotelmatobacter sp.]